MRGARRGRAEPKQEAGTPLLSRRRHHVLPGQEEHPEDHGESGAAALRAGRLGSPVRSPGRDGDPGLGLEAAVSPAGAAGATQTERPWGLGKTKQRGNPNTGVEKSGLCRLLSHRPVVPQERRAHGSPRTPAPPGGRGAPPQARGAFCLRSLLGGAGCGEMTPFPRALGSPTAPLSQLQPRGAARRAARVMECPHRPSSPRPLLACIHPIHIVSASYSGLDS